MIILGCLSHTPTASVIPFAVYISGSTMIALGGFVLPACSTGYWWCCAQWWTGCRGSPCTWVPDLQWGKWQYPSLSQNQSHSSAAQAWQSKQMKKINHFRRKFQPQQVTWPTFLLLAIWTLAVPKLGSREKHRNGEGCIYEQWLRRPVISAAMWAMNAMSLVEDSRALAVLEHKRQEKGVQINFLAWKITLLCPVLKTYTFRK